MTYSKKAEMGVGTLIVFIAMLLVAAVAAGVLIQTASSLQEKSLSTGQQARQQIATTARVIEISATDGRYGNLTDFYEYMKLSPGSYPIKLDQAIFTFNTKDRTSSLKYTEERTKCVKNNTIGYNTWNEEEFDETQFYQDHMVIPGIAGDIISLPVGTDIDLDEDGVNESVLVCSNSQTYCPASYDGEYLKVILSDSDDIYIRFYNQTHYVNTSDTPAPLYMNKTPIGDYGYITITGTVQVANRIWQATGNLMDIEIPREKLEEDYDDDGEQDYFALNMSHALFWISSQQAAGYYPISIPLGNDLDIVDHDYNIEERPITNTTDTFGYFSMIGRNYDSGYFPENGTLEVKPYRLGEGYFSVIYEQEGTNHVKGNLQRGDIIKICFESPRPIDEDELVRLNFIPKIGTNSLTEFVSPDVISTERVYLYP